jgi:non-ribosomal peptide synthetase component F
VQCIKLAAMIFAKQEPQTEDEDILAEMLAQLWAAGLDLEGSQFIARMLFRNGKRIVSAANP